MMPVATLLDVSVLIALPRADHPHHELSVQWFLAVPERPFATCAATQLRLLRLLSQFLRGQQNLPTEMAMDMLRRLVLLPSHQFWGDDVSPVTLLDGRPMTGHQQVTDFYLASLAERRGGTVATLDKALAKAFPHGAVELIGAVS